MAGNDTPQETSLQFDKAEYAGPQTGASVCGVCKQPIAQTYFTVNAAIVCDQCHGKVVEFATRGSKFRRAFVATALGLVAGLAGAALWYVVRTVTGYEIGLIAILVGLMVGLAVRKGSKGRGGWFYQSLAVVLTYGCICAQYMPDIVQACVKQFREAQAAQAQVAAKPPAGIADAKKLGENAPPEKAAPPAVPAPKPGIAKMLLGIALFLVLAFALSLAAPFLAGVQNIMGLIIIGIALLEAWKINKQVPVRIAGPFQLAPLPATAPSGSTLVVDRNQPS
jgi:hypothetical protein